MGRANRDTDVQLTRRQTEKARAAIQVTKLVQRLQAHALGDCELTLAQVNSAKILLAKRLPDETRTEIAFESDAPMSIEEIRSEIIAAVFEDPEILSAVKERMAAEVSG